MIYKNKREIVEIRHNNVIVLEIRHGLTLVWQYIRSSFGKGYWINDKAWSNVDGWNNND